MVLIVKSIETKCIHEIEKLINVEGVQTVWSATWPGEHTVGEDCELIPLSEREWQVVKVALDEPDISIRHIAKRLKYPYNWVFRVIRRNNLQVKAERTARKYRPGLKQNCRGKYYNG